MCRSANTQDRILKWRGPMVIAVLAIVVMFIQGVMTATDFSNTELANCAPKGLPKPAVLPSGNGSYVFKSSKGALKSQKVLTSGDTVDVEYMFPEGCRLNFFALSYSSDCRTKVEVYRTPFPGAPAFVLQKVFRSNDNDKEYFRSLSPFVLYPVHALVKVTFSTLQRQKKCNISGYTSGSGDGGKFVPEVELYAQDIIKCGGVPRMSRYYPLVRDQKQLQWCCEEYDSDVCGMSAPVTENAQLSPSPTTSGPGRHDESLSPTSIATILPVTEGSEHSTTEQEASDQVATPTTCTQTQVSTSSADPIRVHVGTCIVSLLLTATVVSVFAILIARRREINSWINTNITQRLSTHPPSNHTAAANSDNENRARTVQHDDDAPRQQLNSENDYSYATAPTRTTSAQADVMIPRSAAHRQPPDPSGAQGLGSGNTYSPLPVSRGNNAVVQHDLVEARYVESTCGRGGENPYLVPRH